MTWRCQKRVMHDGIHRICRFEQSLRSTTWLEGTNIDLQTIGKYFLNYLYLDPPHQDFIQNELSLSSKTTVRWSNIIREAQLRYCLKNTPQTLGRSGTIVEIDEAKFGHHESNRRRKLYGQWVFGGIQRGSKNALLEVVKDRTSETLMEVIHRRILPGTTIFSDGWRAYNPIAKNKNVAPGHVWHGRYVVNLSFATMNISGFVRAKTFSTVRIDKMGVF